jgi:WS/DGAT/MGAT family acyltransferase
MATASGWGTSRELSAFETVMWRAEADPRLRSPVCSLEELDCAPDWERLVTAHDWATRAVPRLRQRVVEPALGLSHPEWLVDEHFDLAYHLRRVRLPDGARFSDVLAAAARVGMTPFDRARPPWEAVLFEGLPDGRAAYLFKFHHATSDGVGALQLFGALRSLTREDDPAGEEPPAPGPESTSHLGALTRQAVRDARGGLHALRRTAVHLRRPDQAINDALGYGSSLRRVLADPPAEGSPLLRGRSLTRRFLAFDVAFADLRGAAKAVGASLNDAFLAALLGGFRRYHEQLGVPIDTMPIAIPVSVRRPDDPGGGNRIAALRLAGPVGLADPAERMLSIRASVLAGREEPALEGVTLLAPALARLPGVLTARLAGRMTVSTDLQATNVPGIREEIYLAGARVERLYGMPPLPGLPTMVSLVSHGDVCCIGVNLDPAAVTEADLFARCVAEGLDEVLALHPGADAAVQRT